MFKVSAVQIGNEHTASAPGSTVLLDGLFGAPWRLRKMQHSLQQRGLGPVRIFSYDSTGRTPIEVLAQQFREFCGPEPVRVVAHSMGGLVTRSAKMQFPNWELKRAAFLCVPHHGSVVARLLPFRGVRQMRPRSEFLQQLNEQEWTVPTLCVWCPGDLLVVPGASARWEKAERELRCKFPLHNWPVISASYHQSIADFLNER